MGSSTNSKRLWLNSRFGFSWPVHEIDAKFINFLQINFCRSRLRESNLEIFRSRIRSSCSDRMCRFKCPQRLGRWGHWHPSKMFPREIRFLVISIVRNSRFAVELHSVSKFEPGSRLEQNKNFIVLLCSPDFFLFFRIPTRNECQGPLNTTF